MIRSHGGLWLLSLSLLLIPLTHLFVFPAMCVWRALSLSLSSLHLFVLSPLHVCAAFATALIPKSF